jgi:hypothetical protein
MIMSRYIDDNGAYIGPRPSNDEERARGDAAYYQTLGRGRVTDHISLGANKHHDAFIRVRTDELLFRDGVIPAYACNKDCELGALPELRRIARDMILMQGGTPPGIDESLLTFSRALRESDFPSLLENIGSKALMTGWDNASENWPLWVKQSVTPDFRQFGRVGAAEASSPQLVAANAEIKQATITGDLGEKAQLQSYAHLINYSRQSMVSDDLRALTIDMAAAGRSVARLIGDLAYAILTDNNAMADGENLFSAAHSNQGTGGDPSVALLDEAFSLMGSQEGLAGEKLNLKPRFIIAAPGRATTLAVLASAVNSIDPSIPSDIRIIPLVDSRLTGDPWFILCDPMVSAAVEIVTLEGSTGPRLEQKRVKNDGVSYLVGHDVVALACDYRGVVSNAGS